MPNLHDFNKIVTQICYLNIPAPVIIQVQGSDRYENIQIIKEAIRTQVS